MIRFRTLGAVELQTDGGTAVDSLLAQTKRLGLLAYLAVSAPGGFVRRDTLLAMFWQDLDDERARGALNQALYYLRRELGPKVVRTRGRDAVGLDPARLWCDASELEVILGDERPDVVAAAVEGFSGPFLPGFHLQDAPEFMDWLDRTRNRLNHRVAVAAWTIAEALEEAGHSGRALALGRKALTVEPAGEERLRTYLQMCMRAGERAGALASFEEFARRMQRDYDLGVSPETLALVERIRSRWETDGGSRHTHSHATRSPPMSQEGTVKAAAAVVADGPSGPLVPIHGRSKGAARRSSTGRLLAVAGVMFLVAAGLWWSTIASGPPRAGEEPRAQRVAVLPFTNLSPVEGDEFLAEGLALEVVSRLSRVRGLVVLPMTSTRTARPSNPDAPSMGNALNAAWLVDGSLRRVDGVIRIMVQLVDAPGDRTLWSKEFDLSGAGLRQFEVGVTEEVARALQLEVRDEAERRLAARAGDEEVYRGYLLGRALLGRLDPPSLEAARDHFLNVIAKDSSFSPAWSGLAAAYLQMTSNGSLDGGAGADSAYRAAREALRLDPESAEAYASLAIVQSNVLWDADAADRNFRVAIGLDPSSTQALRGYANHLRNLGRFDEALGLIERVRELEPNSTLPALEEGIIRYLRGEWDLARDLARRILQESPAARRARTLLALTEVAAGRYRQAAEILDPQVLGVRRSDNEALRARALALAGDEAAAGEILAWIEANGPTGNRDFHQAVVLTALGENADAIELLERAAEDRSWLVRLIGVEPTFQPLRNEPGFMALRGRLGL